MSEATRSRDDRDHHDDHDDHEMSCEQARATLHGLLDADPVDRERARGVPESPCGLLGLPRGGSRPADDPEGACALYRWPLYPTPRSSESGAEPLASIRQQDQQDGRALATSILAPWTGERQRQPRHLPRFFSVSTSSVRPTRARPS